MQCQGSNQSQQDARQVTYSCIISLIIFSKCLWDHILWCRGTEVTADKAGLMVQV